MKSRAFGVVLVFAACVVGSAAAEMTVHFVDVGQGGGVFIQKDGKNIVYDCGDTFAATTMIDYLVAHDVETIHVLIPSHAHKDHMGACPAVMKTFKVGTVYHNDSDAATGAWKAFRNAAEMHAHEIIPVNENMQTDLFQILVAYDGRDRFSKEADNSILVLVDGDVRVLLTGDCEAVCEKAVSPHLKRIDVLNVGHHGSNAASSPPFLKLLSPKVAAISAGANNQFGHPTKPVLLRLKQVKAEILRTDQEGTIVVRSNGTSFKIETEK